jgi:tRNA(Ile)-lysidine synthase
MILDRFIKYIKDNQLFFENSKILVTISGGADSVTLLDLLIRGKYNCAVAHCNFNLRGENSDTDEIFVMETAGKYNLKFHGIGFETEKFAKSGKYSIEEAARILRYDWFEKIRTENKYDVIATAHHADDNSETFFINITKGTGIRGISGIKNKNKKIVRPLLFLHRSEIEKYCSENNLQYRTDESNFETKYVRNKIRHKIIPLFEEINPNFKATMAKNLIRFSELEKIYFEAVENAEKICVTKENQFTKINIPELLKTQTPHSFLFEFLRLFNFNSSVCEDLLENLKTISGKIFRSLTHEAVKDREYIIVRESVPKQDTNITIQTIDSKIDTVCNLHFEIFEKSEDFQISANPEIALLDADTIDFPFVVRNPKESDFFFPLGMTQKKLLSDFFIDLKLNLFEKEEIRLLTSRENIVWIVGKRIDNRFKITEITKRILKITIVTKK